MECDHDHTQSFPSHGKSAFESLKGEVNYENSGKIVSNLALVTLTGWLLHRIREFECIFGIKAMTQWIYSF